MWLEKSALGKQQDLGLESGRGQAEGLFIPFFMPSHQSCSCPPSHTHFPFILLYILTFQSSLLPISQLSHTLKAPTMPQALAEALYTV